MPALRGMIVAMSPERAIGLGGKIPWHHTGDMKRFKRVTLDSTVIMGRLTWESMGQKPLPKRRNLVVTRRALPNVECFPDIHAALASSTGTVWFIGGARIYEAAMQVCDLIDVTFVPDNVPSPDAVHFPAIDPKRWRAGPMIPHEDEPTLARRVYTRIVA